MHLPQRIIKFPELCRNVWWAWHREGRELGVTLARILGRDERTPWQLFSSLSDEEIDFISRDERFLASYDQVLRAYDVMLTNPSWWNARVGDARLDPIAFFSAEFGLHESIPIYSGGLGILAGDILKSASDLGVPLVGVGLFYHEGYFHQHLSPQGVQHESYPYVDPLRLPFVPVMQNDSRLEIRVELGEEEIFVQIWQIDVGRTKLLLLDTNVERNSPYNRAITARLYGGDAENRIRQEFVLGIGGSRALSSIGIQPKFYHMNEGHSAFLALEQVLRIRTESGLAFEEAVQEVSRSHLFTTHTPVAAGNDVFWRELVEKYLRPFTAKLEVDTETILRLGRVHPDDYHEPFSMSVLGFRTSAYANAVSKLHGQVSRDIWKDIWPGRNVEELPLTHVTNGVHIQSWIAPEMAELFDRTLTPDWRRAEYETSSWEGVSLIPDGELWNARRLVKRRVLEFCRSRLAEQLEHQHALPAEIAHARAIFHPDALVIGFARRFALYKRANLILRDWERLLRLLRSKDRPIQFIFSGKAHPADQPAKDFIHQVFHAAHHGEVAGRIVMLEDYNMEIARNLIQGVDIWLNTPRRPLEASGTSGMKAVVNGVLNCSIPDGWWAEAFDGENGWAIGEKESPDHTEQDRLDSESLFDVIENQIIPAFFNRSADGVPEEWLKKMKRSISTLAPQFSASRMVIDYATRFYAP